MENHNAKTFICLKCGQINPPQSKFCFKCGSVVNALNDVNVTEKADNEASVKCSKCGQLNSSRDKFCMGCGNNLTLTAESVNKEKRCVQCSSVIRNNARFCHVCGSAADMKTVEQEKKSAPDFLICGQCGKKNASFDRFCTGCGYPLKTFTEEKTEGTDDDIIVEARKFAGKAAHSIMQKAVELTGEEEITNIQLRDLFSNVFKKHTKNEQDEIFICGTSFTTPDESSILSEWPKPWLYSRIFLVFAITFFLLLVMGDWFQNTNAVPGLIFIGALAVPFTTMIFFFEVNVPRNISIFETIRIFFIGGTLSMLSCLVLFTLMPSGAYGYVAAIITGIVEEIAKLVVVAYFCKKPSVKYILTGALIGSAVGAGFAAFETAGYAFRFLLDAGWNEMMEVIFLRAVLAIGGHVTWAAVSGAALVLVKKDSPLNAEHIFNIRFLRLFAVPVILHSVWDMPISFGSEICLVQIVATLLIWLIALVLISVGLKQFSKPEAETPEAQSSDEEKFDFDRTVVSSDNYN